MVQNPPFSGKREFVGDLISAGSVQEGPDGGPAGLFSPISAQDFVPCRVRINLCPRVNRPVVEAFVFCTRLILWELKSKNRRLAREFCISVVKEHLPNLRIP